MKVTGIIAEYNPFHNGHLRQIEAARAEGADFVIAAMSGDFVQRGEPAVFDKYTRAHMALAAGADLVLELPACFATASAEDFAGCGVALFTALGVVDTLSFGTECGDLSVLGSLAGVLVREPEPFTRVLRERLRAGASFPEARADALLSCPEVSAKARELLLQPNNILALEYLKAIQKQGSPLRPVTLIRTGAGYHERRLSPDDGPVSASALRTELARQQRAGLPFSVPEAALPKTALRALYTEGALSAPLFPDDFSAPLACRLLTADYRGEELTEFADVSQELAARLKRLALSPASFTETAAAIKTRSYTAVRINRALLHILLSVRAEENARRKENGFVFFARVLGFRKSAEPLLSQIKRTSSIPLVTKVPDALKTLSPDAAAALRQDLYVSHFWQTVAALKGRRVKNEYTRALLVLPQTKGV